MHPTSFPAGRREIHENEVGRLLVHNGLPELEGGEIRDTKTFNLLRNIVSLQVFVDVSRFSPCVINLSRNRNIVAG